MLDSFFVSKHICHRIEESLNEGNNLANIKQQKKRNKDFNKSSGYYLARYSGLVFEMLGIIALGTFLGHKIDSNRNSGFPLWTIILSLLSIAIALYIVLKDLLHHDS